MKIGFRTLHPVTNLIFFLFAFVFCLTNTNPFALSVSFVCGAVYGMKLQKKRIISYILKFILPMILLITAFNGIFSHYGETVLFAVGNSNFTAEALVYGFVSAVKLASMLLWLESFNENVSNDKITFLFGRFSPRIALIISMVLRFIPLIREQSYEIAKAEKGIGNAPESVGFTGKMRSASRRLSVLVSWTLEKGIDTSDSMRSRGYGLKGRTMYNSYRFTLTDALLTLVSLSAAVLTFVTYKRLYSSYNPVIDIPVTDVFSVVVIVFFAAVLLMPFIVDLREEKKWSTSQLKT